MVLGLEEAAAAKHADAVKMKKAQRAMRRVEDSVDDNANLEGDDDEELNPVRRLATTCQCTLIFSTNPICSLQAVLSLPRLLLSRKRSWHSARPKLPPLGQFRMQGTRITTMKMR